MCLNYISDEKTSQLKSMRKSIVVYKILKKIKNRNGKQIYKPPFSSMGASSHFVFTKGKNVDPRSETEKISCWDDDVLYPSGFHSFLKKEEAKRYRNDNFKKAKSIVIIKALVKPSDILVVGSQDGVVGVSSSITINSFAKYK